jgi:hypothetical protein
VTRAARRSSPQARDPYGLGPVGSAIGPIASVIGLLVIGVITLNLFNYELPFAGGTGGNGNGTPGGPAITPAPSNVIVVPEEATFLGSIVYAKAGNIWVQTDQGATQLTDGGGASMPSFSADGAWVTYVQSIAQKGKWPVRGRPSWYDIELNEPTGAANPSGSSVDRCDVARCGGPRGSGSRSCLPTASRSRSSPTRRSPTNRTWSCSSTTSRASG